MIKILLVEDDKIIVASLSEYLNSEGYLVRSVSGQAAAMKLLAEEKADLVLLDVSLAEGNGFAACRAIKAEFDVPVIFLTASGDEFSTVTGFDLGADDYIPKPFRPRELISRIRNVLRLTGSMGKTVKLGDVVVDTEKGTAVKNSRDLHSEIYKMTIRLREQQQTLTREKAYLADSIADISHQIRTPLTSINLLIGLLSEPKLTDARRQQLIHELYELLSRIDWLITTLLKISRLDAGTVQFKQEQVSLEELLKKSCVTLLIPMELRGQVLLIHADGAFRGDFSWSCEAIGNIVKNCMEHTPEGGRIEIDATENALFSEIIIKDNGTGISPEDLPHIFERFYKGKDSDGKSFGIGLALSRMIIAGQGGTVKAENRKPVGAMFTIRFYKGTV